MQRSLRRATSRFHYTHDVVGDASLGHADSARYRIE